MKMAQKQDTIAAFPTKASPVTRNLNDKCGFFIIVSMPIWMTVIGMMITREATSKASGATKVLTQVREIHSTPLSIEASK